MSYPKEHKCPKCDSLFIKKSKNYGYCSACDNERCRIFRVNNKDYYKKYRKTRTGKEATLRAVQNYERRNPEKRLAWTKAQAVQREPCEICGREDAVRHHPDYDKPLDVVMLCPLHHKEAHRQPTNV